jgi:hypothetical protein
LPQKEAALVVRRPKAQDEDDDQQDVEFDEEFQAALRRALLDQLFDLLRSRVKTEFTSLLVLCSSGSFVRDSFGRCRGHVYPQME